MYTLILVTYATVFAIAPQADGKLARNEAAAPAFSVSVTKAGTYDNETACRQVADLIRDRETAYGMFQIEAHCMTLAQSPAGQASASNQ